MTTMTGSNDGWLVEAKKLPTGGRGRYPHECGSGEAMIISNNRNGYSGYCNRCHENVFHPHGQRSFKELMELRRRDKEFAEQLSATVRLPWDFTLDIPLDGRLWLFQASITPHMARQAGIGYSDYFKRVIIPVYNGSELVYFQARALYKEQQPKYINPKVDRSAIGYWVIPEGADHEKIVVVEDILSAIRVGKFIPAFSALGTKLSIPLANQLMQYQEVITWLDSDEAGVSGAHDMRKLLMAVKTSNIVTELDPKHLTDAEIEQRCLSMIKEKS